MHKVDAHMFNHTTPFEVMINSGGLIREHLSVQIFIELWRGHADELTDIIVITILRNSMSWLGMLHNLIRLISKRVIYVV